MTFLFRWLSSLKLTVWALTILIGVFFAGAYLMPLHPEAHGGINAMPLFQWWTRFGRHELPASGWLPVSFLLLFLLTLNTLVCTLRSMRWGPSLWAHVTHAGFLLILLAHLVSAATGFRQGRILLPQGHSVDVPRLHLKLKLNRLDSVPYPGGMPMDYSARIIFSSEDGTTVKDLGPNRPAFYRGIPVYLKTYGFRPVPYAVCEIVHDPGAPVALAGSVIFLIGALPLPFLGRKTQDPASPGRP